MRAKQISSFIFLDDLDILEALDILDILDILDLRKLNTFYLFSIYLLTLNQSASTHPRSVLPSGS